MSAVGVANFRRVSKIRDPLDFVPEPRELPTLSEERVPAIKFGPRKFFGQPCAMELSNPSAVRSGSPQKAEEGLTLFRGVPVS